MYEFIKGKLVELTPTYAVLENNNIGYFLNISLTTASELKAGQECILYIHEIVKEDSHSLFAFYSKEERQIFRLLISVNGVGPNTARLVLSSLSYKNLISAISGENVEIIKSVKGIGSKTAQRIIIDLKDKISSTHDSDGEILAGQNNTLAIDSLSALTMLGFTKTSVEKVVNKIINENKDNKSLTVENVVKQALNYL